jgi:hypothetical protein
MAALLLLAGASAQHDAHLGLILPFTNEGVELAGMSWKQVICGAQLAVAHVNEGNESVVSGLRGMTSNLTYLNSTMFDTGCTARAGSKRLLGVARAAMMLCSTSRDQVA